MSTLVIATWSDKTVQEFNCAQVTTTVRHEPPEDVYDALKGLIYKGELEAFSLLSLPNRIMRDDLANLKE
jgi:hypothetical protein